MRGFFFFRFLVVGLLLLALMGAVGTMVFRSGFAEGYFAGQVAATTDGSVAEVAVQGYQGIGRGFSMGALCLNTLFLFLLFGFAMRLVGRARWRPGRKHGAWRGGPRHGYGQGRRSWCDEMPDDDKDAPPKGGLDYV